MFLLCLTLPLWLLCVSSREWDKGKFDDTVKWFGLLESIADVRAAALEPPLERAPSLSGS